MCDEFKKFAFLVNVLDLAVGVVIGGAFGKIVTSLVNDIIMPLFGLLFGGIDFSTLTYPAGAGDEGLKYGAFIQSVVDFFIIAFSIFLFIRLINRFKRKKEVIEEKKEELKTDVKEELLTEIRDLLKNQANNK